TFVEVDLSGRIIKGCTFDRCTIMRCTFSGCTITATKFRNCKFEFSRVAALQILYSHFYSCSMKADSESDLSIKGGACAKCIILGEAAKKRIVRPGMHEKVFQHCSISELGVSGDASGWRIRDCTIDLSSISILAALTRWCRPKMSKKIAEAVG